MKIFVGLSGGVDSSVAAALLIRAGHKVTGAYIKTWQPDWLPCTWKEERRDAMRVAAKLGIPFVTIDCEKEYKEGVADYMIREYKQGRTPNPDIMCNREVKFGAFLQKAKALGADMIATGHYAQNINGVLYESVDKDKDQSYFLWTLSTDILKQVLFPVGHLHKKQVRALAQKFGLPTAVKKDSQGICFLGNIDMKEFLKHYITEKKGNVLDTSGKIIGYHDGAWFLTIGERHGFTITEKGNHDTPYYVVSKNIENNTVTVSHRNANTSHLTTRVTLQNTLFRRDLPAHLGARIRYRQTIQKVSISGNTVTFDVPQEGVSPGQSVVLYDGEECIGGGIIDQCKS